MPSFTGIVVDAVRSLSGESGLAGLAAPAVGVDFQKMGGGSIDGLSASEIIYPSISAEAQLSSFSASS